jgi:hypothetical protein
MPDISNSTAGPVQDDSSQPPNLMGGAQELSKNQTFDVHSDYPWTLTPANSQLRKYVPQLELIEYDLQFSGEVQSIKTLLNATLNSKYAQTVVAGVVTGIGAATATKALNVIGDVAAGGGAGKAGPAIAKAVTNGVVQAGVAIAGAAAGYGLAKEFIDQIPSLTNLDYLAPYKNLYPAIPTGNKYYLPYLNVENFTNVSGVWGSVELNRITTAATTVAGAGGAIAGLAFGEAASLKFDKQLAGVLEIGKGIQNVAELEFALRAPGASIENIKKFKPKEDGDTITVTFYLYNTQTQLDIVNNWKFLYYLTYQNLPNRRSSSLLDPPCVYEVNVPGYKRFPIAVIESFNVTNEGTTRLVDITTGEMSTYSTGSTNNNVKIVPEAYKVSITFKSLLTSTRNLLRYSNDQSKITVTDPSPEGSFGTGENKWNNPKPPEKPKPTPPAPPEPPPTSPLNPNGVHTD